MLDDGHRLPDSSSDWTIFLSGQMRVLVQTIAFHGIDTTPIDVQVHIANGLPTIAIVGLADKAVAELRERVRAACGPKVAWASGLDIIAAPDLASLLNHLKGVKILSSPEPKYLSTARSAG